MPHVEIGTGSQSATFNAFARHLIPGIEPGGSRGGDAMKPVLFLRDAWIELLDMNLTTANDYNAFNYSLKLSQEESLNPGLLLPVGIVGSRQLQTTAVGEASLGANAAVHDLFHAHGTLWAPSFVGVQGLETGGADVDISLHMDYEVVMVPWMEWFLMWEFLDNVIDNTKDY